MKSRAPSHEVQSMLSWPTIERLVDTVGEADFKDTLLNSIDDTLLVSDCVVFFAGQGQLSSLFEVSQFNPVELSWLIGRYLEHFSEPGRKISYRKIGVPDRAVHCKVMNIEEVETQQFRRGFYGAGDFVGHAWAITRHEDGFIALSAFKRRTHGQFEDDQIERFARLAPLFMPFIKRHARALTSSQQAHVPLPLEHAKEMIAATAVSLAPRELDVCARILRGMTSEAIALDLNTSIHTVRTHRKRAYRKMHVSSIAELFSQTLSRTRATLNRV